MRTSERRAGVDTPLAPTTVDRWLTVVAELALLVAILNTVRVWQRHEGHAPFLLFALVILVLAVGAGWVLVALARGRPILWPLRVVVAGGVVVAIVSPFVENEPPGAVGQPWQIHLYLLASFAAVVAAPLRIGIPLSAVVMAGYAALLDPGRGPVTAVLTAALLFLVTQFGGLLVLLSRLGAQDLAQGVAAESRARSGEARGLAHESATRWWRSKVHGDVLSVLDLGVEVTDASLGRARDRARTALADPDVRPPGAANDLITTLRTGAAAQGISLDVDVDASGAPPEQVIEALAGALTEALANVAQHSGTRHAVLAGRITPVTVDLSVSDSGVGFDPSAKASSWGLRRGVRERLEAVGGRADIRSGPRAGTTVTGTWEAPLVDTVGWFPRQRFAWLLVPAVADIAIHLVLALRIPGSVHSTGVLLSSAVLVLATLLAAAASGRRPLLAPAAAIALPLTVAVALANTVPVHFTDFRTWVTGASVPTAAALAVVGHRRTALVAAGAALATTLVGGGLLGYRVDLLVAVGAQLVLLPGWAVAVFHLLDRQAWQRREAAAAAAAAYTRTLELDERARQWAAGVSRVRVLVGPALEHLARARRADDALRNECRRARDALRAELETA